MALPRSLLSSGLNARIHSKNDDGHAQCITRPRYNTSRATFAVQETSTEARLLLRDPRPPDKAQAYWFTDLRRSPSSSLDHISDFHVVMIVFTLVLTMILCHFIIRLCMLCFRFRARVLRRERERSCTMDEGADEDYAQPETPIPIILARDEELGLHDDASADSDSVRPVQHPPPAYGLWRSSVRANPDLIHWQRNDGSLLRQCEGETPDLAQHPAMRPPTYHSREPLREPEAASSVYSASPLPMLQPVAYRW
ncbi:MAG: hypothetical protein Q9193_004417 [Seirophora villosa]